MARCEPGLSEGCSMKKAVLLTWYALIYEPALLSPAASQKLYTQKLYPIILRYVISEYSMVEVQSADTYNIGGVLLGNSFSSMVDVILHSLPSPELQFW